MITMAATQLIIMYTAIVLVIYLRNQNKVNLNKIQVAKISLRVIMNHLNEAVFLRTDEGKLSYCNDHAVRIVEKACSHTFENKRQMDCYLS